MSARAATDGDGSRTTARRGERMERGLLIFEDQAIEQIGPLVTARPASELMVGGLTLRERLAQVCGQPVRYAIARPCLQAVLPEWGLTDQRRCASQHGCGAGAVDRAPLCIHAAWVADTRIWPQIDALEPGEGLTVPAGAGDAPDLLLAYRADDCREACRIADGKARPAKLTRLEGEPGTRLLRHGWELVAWSGELLGEDLERGADGDRESIWTHQSAQIHESAVLDAAGGPIWIGEDVRIAPFTTIEGPARIGAGARVLGGRIAGSVIGAGCRVRGEVERSVMLNWSNKAHDGFLGHAYVGSWVNLGAGTTNSDLKNTYGEVRMWEAGAYRPTGRRKLGCLIGDHVKTAIGTLLPTGGVIGVGAQLFGGAGLAPRWVPAFAWGLGARAEAIEWASFLRTARTVLERRGQVLSAAAQALLEQTYENTQGERTQWLGERQRGS
ncbi:MAG: hypothetical protein GF330_11900 [Candidatus Eisenbacteria bacterium]|nr:hypothetical protein [Candidatus Eisenbacteria bacterium]